jgi:putative transposase
MSRYRRSRFGTAFFFTLVAYDRRPILCDRAIRTALRRAILDVQAKRPFRVDAWVLLPDHLHCIWTLPDADSDFSMRWNLIKRSVSVTCREQYRQVNLLTPSGRHRQESTIWQRRFWEHRIVDDEDFARHVDYVHFNPVKHGLVSTAGHWPYSTYHRFVASGTYPADWGVAAQDGNSMRE